jgi:hypothetical protein
MDRDTRQSVWLKYSDWFMAATLIGVIAGASVGWILMLVQRSAIHMFGGFAACLIGVWCAAFASSKIRAMRGWLIGSVWIVGGIVLGGIAGAITGTAVPVRPVPNDVSGGSSLGQEMIHVLFGSILGAIVGGCAVGLVLPQLLGRTAKDSAMGDQTESRRTSS